MKNAALGRPQNLGELQGRVVLVKSARDQHNPATAMRGTIEVRESEKGIPRVGIAVEFPQMFTTRARHRVIELDDTALDRLLNSENNGTYEFTIADELE